MQSENNDEIVTFYGHMKCGEHKQTPIRCTEEWFLCQKVTYMEERERNKQSFYSTQDFLKHRPITVLEFIYMCRSVLSVLFAIFSIIPMRHIC